MTERQRFMRVRSRRARYLFCSICLLEPPKFVYGVCDDCDAA